jgi:hypothetical protein
MTGKEVANFRALKLLGIPYSRTHIVRLMEPKIRRSSGSRKKGTYREWFEPNPDAFPRCFKLGGFRNSPPVWYVHEVIAWLEAKAKAGRS